VIIEAAIMLGLFGYYRSWPVAVILIGLFAFRRVPQLADAIAFRLELESYDGMTAYVARLALPAWSSARGVMSRSEGAPADRSVHDPVHVPVQGTALVSAKPAADRDIIIDGWIVDMANARDEKGGDLFSANDIFKAVGGHRAAVLARVKQIRSGAPPAQFRQDDGSTAPAEYPVTRSA